MKNFTFVIWSAVFSLFYSNGIAQIVNIEDRRSDFKDSIGWHEQLDLGFSWIENDKSIIQFDGGAQLEFLFDDRRLLSISKLRFVKAGKDNFVNEGFEHLRYNVKWTPWLIYETFGQIQYNEKLLLKLRGLLGTGMRLVVYQKQKQNLFVGLSYMFEYDEEAKNNIIHQDHRMSSYFSASININERVNINSTTYYQPLWTKLNDYRISSETKLAVDLAKHIKLVSGFSLNYDSRAPESAPDLVYALSTGIRIER